MPLSYATRNVTLYLGPPTHDGQAFLRSTTYHTITTYLLVAAFQHDLPFQDSVLSAFGAAAVTFQGTNTDIPTIKSCHDGTELIGKKSGYKGYHGPPIKPVRLFQRDMLHNP